MIIMTIFYIAYTSYAKFFESKGAKCLEIINESLFCLIQYNFLLLNNLIEDEIAIQCGNIISSITAFLLFINFCIIAIVSFRAIKRKILLRSLKKRAMKAAEERNRIKAISYLMAQVSDISQSSDISSRSSSVSGIERTPSN